MSLKRQNRGLLITAVFFCAAAILLVASVVGMYWIGLVALRSNSQLSKQRSVLGRLERIGSALKETESSQRGYLLTGDEAYLAPFSKAESTLSAELQAIQSLAVQKELSESDVTELTRLIQEKLSEMGKTIKLRREGNMAAAMGIVRLNRGKELMDSVRRNLEHMEEVELAQFDVANHQAERATRQRNLTFICTGCLNLAFLGWAFMRISLEMRTREAAQADLEKSHDELERRVQERTRDLEVANKELEAFGYSVSHDLRAPLRHVSSYIKLLDKSAGPGLDEENRKYVRIIAEAAQRMGHLIDDLLVLSRIGRATIAETTVNLGEVVNDVRGELAPETSARAIEWKVEPLPRVRGDATLLRAAMMNLVSNAVKYTRPRNPAVIEIASRQENGEIICYVRDNGAGFDMKYADKLFGVFQRLHDRADFEGTGIGLASVRRIIQRHGGRTWAEGQVDRGATFYFSMPNERVI